MYYYASVSNFPIEQNEKIWISTIERINGSSNNAETTFPLLVI
jgi:hypothetical protein